MLVVRDVFNIKFGRMREALELWQEGKQHIMNNTTAPPRLMTDLTGDYYTLVLESQFNNLADYEQAMQTEMQKQDWRNWYQKFTPLVESGRREMFNVVGQ